MTRPEKDAGEAGNLGFIRVRRRNLKGATAIGMADP